MPELQDVVAGYSFVTKLLNKVEVITMASDDILPESISKQDRETINLMLTQIVATKSNLEELDQAILAAITSEQELEKEVTVSEMYHFELTELVFALQKFSIVAKSVPETSISTQQFQTPHSEDSRNTEQQVPPENNPGATDQVVNTDEESLPEHRTSSGAVSDQLPNTLWVSL